MQSLDQRPVIIETRNVSFSYDGVHEVLCEVSLKVRKGDYVGVIGPNGGGKTTLIKILLGILRPSSGEVFLFDKDLHSFRQWGRIGYVPQRGNEVDRNFPITVEEVVEMGRYAHRGVLPLTPIDNKAIEKALKTVGMFDFRDTRIGDLSGGQQQRVFVARTLASEPEAIFLDEPTVGIDQKTEEDFYALLRDLNRRLHLTLILVSHDLQRVAKEATAIAVVNRGLEYYEDPHAALSSVAAGGVPAHHHA